MATQGQGLAEYALILALVASVAIIARLSQIGESAGSTKCSKKWDSVVRCSTATRTNFPGASGSALESPAA